MCLLVGGSCYNLLETDYSMFKLFSEGGTGQGTSKSRNRVVKCVDQLPAKSVRGGGWGEVELEVKRGLKGYISTTTALLLQGKRLGN